MALHSNTVYQWRHSNSNLETMFNLWFKKKVSRFDIKIHSSPQNHRQMKAEDRSSKKRNSTFRTSSIWIYSKRMLARMVHTRWFLFPFRFSQHSKSLQFQYIIICVCYVAFAFASESIGLLDCGTAAYYSFFFFVWLVWLEQNDKDRDRSKTERDAQNCLLQRKKTG